MPMREEHPIRYLRKTLLEQNQQEFGHTVGMWQSRVSELESGCAPTTEEALKLWEVHGMRLRGMGLSFERFVRRCAQENAASESAA